MKKQLLVEQLLYEKITTCLCLDIKAHFCDAYFKMMDESGFGDGFCDRDASG